MLNIIIKIIEFPFKILAFVLIYFYKYLISPLLPKSCIYTPTCSNYMMSAIKHFGVFHGIVIGMQRLFRCVPWHKGGYDPVPLNIKGDYKWIF